MASNNNLTQLLNQWRTGDQQLLNDIVPAVYTELHRVAKSKMHGQPAEHTLQATALVNEAFLRLHKVGIEFENRDHFIGVVANLMRQILVDHARSKQAQKRGGGVANLDLDDVVVAADAASVDVLALEGVLESLEKTQPRMVRIAELLYFCGATTNEAATVLDVSVSTLQRDHKLLKALLMRSLSA